MVEEFGGAARDAERDEDVGIMKSRGLVQFCADDYLGEIQPLFARYGLSSRNAFLQAPAMAWI